MTYPTTLPCPLLSVISHNIPANGVRSTFNYAQKQIHTHNENSTFEYGIVIQQHLVSLFEDFYNTDLKNGMGAFDADFLIEGSTTTKKYRFSTPYTITNLGGLQFSIKAQIEVLTKGGF